MIIFQAEKSATRTQRDWIKQRAVLGITEPIVRSVQIKVLYENRKHSTTIRSVMIKGLPQKLYRKVIRSYPLSWGFKSVPPPEPRRRDATRRAASPKSSSRSNRSRWGYKWMKLHDRWVSGRPCGAGDVSRQRGGVATRSIRKGHPCSVGGFRSGKLKVVETPDANESFAFSAAEKLEYS